MIAGYRNEAVGMDDVHGAVDQAVAFVQAVQSQLGAGHR